jgi:hypothetical protein
MIAPGRLDSGGDLEGILRKDHPRVAVEGNADIQRS